MKCSSRPLNSKIIQDVWRLTKQNLDTNLWKQSYLKKCFSKDNFSRITVSLAVKLSSSSILTMF